MPKPNFFIVGAPKAGTTSLFRYLSKHPGVFFPHIKEPNYFSRVELKRQSLYYTGKSVLGLTKERYEGLYKNARAECAIGDASVSYLFYPKVAFRIKKHCPTAKIIVILRNPIDRAISHYLMDYTSGYFSYSIEEVLEKTAGVEEQGVYQQVVELGYYKEQVERYIRCFGIANVMVIFQEEMKADTQKVTNRVCEFLGLEPVESLDFSKQYHVYKTPKNAVLTYFYRAQSVKSVVKWLIPLSLKNRLKGMFMREAEKPHIDASIRQKLKEAYAQDVEKLSSLLGKDLSQIWKDFP